MDKVKFAVVREDPVVEETIINSFGCKNVLLIASGGCSALTLKAKFPAVKFTLFDTNPAQIALVKNKIATLNNFDQKLFNIEDDDATCLNNCGEFESLFRNLRFFINEFILKKEHIEQIFRGETSTARQLLLQLVQNKYWPVAFELFFSNALLITMFGKDAIQHAIPNSYPTYFRLAIEAGFDRVNFQKNYFLQHIFLGYYINDKSSLPYYLTHKNSTYDFDYIGDTLLNIAISGYDCICLSNIFDWMDENKVQNHLQYLSANTAKGMVILFRQLNNKKDYNLARYGFMQYLELEESLTKQEKSFFYNKINIAVKN